MADRQTGNVILKFGSDEQRERFLPPICRGELGFSIGMSEPDSGSDLASVTTRAERSDDGWIVNGTKIWTSNAHMNDWFICLLRTAPMEDGNKHAGLSQFLIDLSSPGLEISPIPFLDGSHHFNEVTFHDVFVPDINVVGQPGMGWHQNTTEMAYERGGPDALALAVFYGGAVAARGRRHADGSCCGWPVRRARCSLVGHPEPVAVGGAADRRRRGAVGGIGAGEGDGDPLRTGSG